MISSWKIKYRRVGVTVVLGLLLVPLVAGSAFGVAPSFAEPLEDPQPPSQIAPSPGIEETEAQAQDPDQFTSSSVVPSEDEKLQDRVTGLDEVEVAKKKTDNPGPSARVLAAEVSPFASLPTPDGVQASMRYHQGYTGKDGKKNNSKDNFIRYGYAPNSTTSGTIGNQGGSPGTGWNIWYSDGYSAWVNTGSTAYSAHGKRSGDSAPGDLSLSQQSALGFAPADVRSVETGQIFNLGRMVHRNNPVQVADSWFQGDLSIKFLSMDLDYRWRLHETKNSATPSDNPKNDDFVDFVKQVSDKTFVQDGLTYTLVVHGFTKPNPNEECSPTLDDVTSVKNEFRTTEGTSTYGCLYASVEQVRQLTIKKEVETPFGAPGSSDSFSFTAVSSLEGSAWQADGNTSFSLKHDERHTAPYNTGERLTFVEAALPVDWKLREISCVDGRGDPLSDIQADTASGKLEIPQSITASDKVDAPITCTYFNVYEPHAKLTLLKLVESEGQVEPVATPQHWTLTAIGTGAVEEQKLEGVTGVSGELITGNYQLSEAPNNSQTTLGYKQKSDWECRDAAGAALHVNNSAISLSPNADVTCTATNVYQVGELQVRKVLDETVPNGSGGISFSGTYSCAIEDKTVSAGSWATSGAGVATLTPADGMPAANKTPVGATCNAQEDALPTSGATGLPNASWKWGEPLVSDGVTITPDQSSQILVTNTALQEIGSATWVKQGETEVALSGSEWVLTGPEAFVDEYKLAPEDSLPVVDCTKSPCDGADQDPRPGYFVIEKLPAGDYTLTETKAPAGYELLADPVTFTVGLDGVAFEVDLGRITNRPLAGPAIPLTGGLGRDMFTIAGLITLGGGGFALISNRVRRRRAM